MIDFLVISTKFGTDSYGMVFIPNGSDSIFAVSSGQSGLAAAVLEHQHCFDPEIIASCLIQILKLNISDLSREYSLLLGPWAISSGQALQEIIDHECLDQLNNVIPNIQDDAWTCLGSQHSVLFLNISKPIKVMQLFSKQQVNMILDELESKVDFEILSDLRMCNANSELVDTAETPPLVWEDATAELLVATYVINSTLHTIVQEPNLIVVHDRPWSKNYQYN